MVIGKINPPPPINPRPQSSQPPTQSPTQGPQPSAQAPRGPQQTAPTQPAPQTQQTARQTPLRQTGRGQLRPTTPSARLSQQQQMTSTATEQRLTSLITSKPVIQTGPQPQLQVLKKHEQHLKPKSEAHESRELEQEEENSPSSVKEKDKPRESEKAPEPQQEAPKQQDKLQDTPTPQPREQQERDSEGGRGRQQQRQPSREDSDEQSGESPKPEAIPEAPPLPGPSQNRYVDQNPNRLVSRPMPRPEQAPPPQQSLSQLDANREQVNRQQLSKVAKQRAQDSGSLTRTRQPLRDVPLAKEVDTGELLRDSLGAPHWKSLVTTHGGRLEQQLRSTVRQSTRDELYAQAIDAGAAIFSASQGQPDTRLQMAICGREQLREIFAREIGNLRPDKYQNPSYEALSERKRELVDKLVEGFVASRDQALSQPQHQAALTGRGGDVAAQAIARVLNATRPSSDEVFSLTLKSRQSLVFEIAVGLGAISRETLDACNRQDADPQRVTSGPPSWQSQVTPAQLAMINTLADRTLQAINQHVPNRPSQTTTTLNTSKGPKVVPDSVTLNGVTYSQPRYLAQGGLGLILEYSRPGSNETVVVKSLLDQSQHDNMAHELRAHRHAMGGEFGGGHPNLVGMRGVMRGSDNALYMVMDKAEGGDLHTLARTLSHAVQTGLPPRAQVALMQSLMLDALQGMQHLQARNMMHLDVKALNFLLGGDGRVMVSDLGSAQRTGRLEGNDIDVPSTYFAPEWNQEKTHKTDVFQLGVVLRAFSSGDQHDKPVSGQQGAMHELINAMLDPDPGKRPTIEGILQHSFMRDAGSQDPGKLAALKLAAIDYAQAVGRPLQSLRREIGDVKKGIELHQVELTKLVPERHGTEIAHRQNELVQLRTRLGQLETRLAQVNQQPQIQPLHQALLQAASGLA